MTDLPPGFYERVLDLQPEAVCVIDGDARLKYVNRAFAALVRRPSDQCIGRSAMDFVHSDDRGWVVEAWRNLQGPYLANPDQQPSWAPVLYQGLRGDGTSAMAEMTAFGALSDPAVGGVIFGFRSAELRSAQKELLHHLTTGRPRWEVLERIVELIEVSPLQLTAAMFDHSGAASSPPVARDVQVIEAFRGVPLSKLVPEAATTPLAVAVDALPEPARAHLSDLGFADFWAVSVLGLDGAPILTVVALRPVLHRPAYAVTERLTEAAETATVALARLSADERLSYAANHDQLTSLPNRRAFFDRLCRPAPEEGRRGVLVVDLDGFKPVNDAHGHAVGDQLLVMVARRLGAVVRPVDLLARLGGDEFVVLREPVESPDQLTALGHRILDQLAKPFGVSAGSVSVSASVGGAIGPGTTDADHLLEAADRAMYEAKADPDGALYVVAVGDGASKGSRIRTSSR